MRTFDAHLYDLNSLSQSSNYACCFVVKTCVYKNTITYAGNSFQAALKLGPKHCSLILSNIYKKIDHCLVNAVFLSLVDWIQNWYILPKFNSLPDWCVKSVGFLPYIRIFQIYCINMHCKKMWISWDISILSVDHRKKWLTLIYVYIVIYICTIYIYIHTYTKLSKMNLKMSGFWKVCTVYISIHAVLGWASLCMDYVTPVFCGLPVCQDED